ncbi:MAG TPA: hypothetical protein VMT62_09725 [Syntrophorhabdaceae bacterium]|nr:hypothetical protein [Syntrophorhabdaceae bacterium]
MVRKALCIMLFLALVEPHAARAYVADAGVVNVRIISDAGDEFASYRTYPRVREQGKYFFMEAVKGERYSIEVANRCDRRVGVVVAVDGRNIISGAKSDLGAGERMYIIEPYTTNTFEGWRTGMERTNRFYFTEQSDSYAEKVFSDASAMGTIAIAVYKEKLPEIMHYQGMSKAPDQATAAPSQHAEAAKRSYETRDKSEQAGTGFGETTYSPSRVVRFEPERTLAERIVLKYEWRTELCKKGVIQCGPKNRLWPEGQGFAPIPKDFRG